MADLLTLYGVMDQHDRESLLELSTRANEPGWWQQFNDLLPQWFSPYLGMEEASTVIRAYEVQGIHDLLQTEDYARKRYRLLDPEGTKNQIDRRVQIQMTRQQVLTRSSPPTLWVVLDEGALRRSPDDVHVMREQVRHLIEMSELPNVVLQIIPFGTYPVPGHSFSTLRFASVDLPDVVYIQHLAGALYLDKPDDVSLYLSVMERLCTMAMSPDETGATLRTLLADL
ncbi:DUF5753 domain-containing protein [Streptosporangium sp. CA-115845]|uniref:DUF5753 domain-containing protein n=1 Tax=Streptosporangium sp. CA-115845 TaxID=3240071 RepID=UPI003D8ED0A1